MFSLTSCPGACCCPSQSLKGAVGATLVLSGARSVLFHLPGVKWMLNESCDVGTADLRESSRSLDSAGSSPFPALSFCLCGEAVVNISVLPL